MYSQYLVLFALIFEMVLLVILMVPLPKSVGAFFASKMKSVNLYFIVTYFILILWLFVNSGIAAYSFQGDVPSAVRDRNDFMRKKFRSERNFYMNCFTFLGFLLGPF
eukprot:TRINITY_DN1727_c0_g1_i2.p1 TRINITY_DN1727_c0_g1~~TRINITY_DN1727_c0_g1_i2.p1  ORF type:complete len:107 (-),score=2.74 TRINITY_DN1727_c0_g1_i2:47-367(-)